MEQTNRSLDAGGGGGFFPKLNPIWRSIWGTKSVNLLSVCVGTVLLNRFQFSPNWKRKFSKHFCGWNSGRINLSGKKLHKSAHPKWNWFQVAIVKRLVFNFWVTNIEIFSLLHFARGVRLIRQANSDDTRFAKWFREREEGRCRKFD